MRSVRSRAGISTCAADALVRFAWLDGVGATRCVAVSSRDSYGASTTRASPMTTTHIVWTVATGALISLAVARGQGQSPAQPRPQGWIVRQSLSDPSVTLYNNVKQKLLDGKQVSCFTISKLDVKLYCEAATHYDYIWFEMQHSTMSFRDVEEMIAACPRPVATPIIRLPDASEGNIQKAADIGALGIDIPTVDTPEVAMQAARFARYPPEGRRSEGAGQAASIWGVNGVNYRKTINDNMLVIVQIETPIGAWNAYNIAAQPGIDVALASNGDVEWRHGQLLRVCADGSPVPVAVHPDSRRCTPGRQVSWGRHTELRQTRSSWNRTTRLRRLAPVL